MDQSRPGFIAPNFLGRINIIDNIPDLKEFEKGHGDKASDSDCIILKFDEIEGKPFHYGQNTYVTVAISFVFVCKPFEVLQ